MEGRGYCHINLRLHLLSFSTVIDYVLADNDLFHKIRNLIIHDFDHLFSDIHCLISCEYEIEIGGANKPGNARRRLNNRPVVEIIKPWVQTKSKNYFEMVEKQNKNSINLKLDELLERSDLCNSPENKKQEINNIVEEINKILTQSATEIFGTNRYPNDKNNLRKNKPWFTLICRQKRRLYLKARRMNSTLKTKGSLESLKTHSKNYKREMNTAINKYENKMRNKIKNLKGKNPKEYWRILKDKNRKEDYNDISIDELFHFFKSQNETTDNCCMNPIKTNLTAPNLDTTRLNGEITYNEVLSAINKTSNNKSCGHDKIYNEYIKCTKVIMIPTYVKLFNVILKDGIFPESWSLGMICPIYKNKGSKAKPENFRPITLLSCLGKLFSSILNVRMEMFLEEHNLLNENQMGFREGYSTTEASFILYALSFLIKNKGDKLFCAFIDLKRAFPSIKRKLLWAKMLDIGIDGIFLKCIQGLYRDIKSTVKLNTNLSPLFNCEAGLREGEHLSPLLFSMFINDLDSYLELKGASSLTISNDNNADLLKIFTLLYADDTTILAKTAKELQKNLNIYSNYCKENHLNINEDKTKIMIFGRKGRVGNQKFVLNNNIIEIVSKFKYLGIIFSANGSFSEHRKYCKMKGTNAMFNLLRKCHTLSLPIDSQIDLFDQTVLPILTYGCELWGMENCDILENIRLRYFKMILKLNTKTPNYVVLGETGKLYIRSFIKKRMLHFWIKIATGKQSRISKIIYNILLKEHLVEKCKWSANIKLQLEQLGLGYIWLEQDIIDTKLSKSIINLRINDQSKQELYESMQISNKGKLYSALKYKSDWENIPPFLNKLHLKEAIYILKIRTSNNNFPVELGRHSRIDYNLRLCPFCLKDIGDGFHYLLQCVHFNAQRKMYLKKYYYNRPNVEKMSELLNSSSLKELKKLSIFSKILVSAFKK